MKNSSKNEIYISTFKFSLFLSTDLNYLDAVKRLPFIQPNIKIATANGIKKAKL